MTSLNDKLEELGALARKLPAALAIEAIWPEAFLDGMSCTLCRVERMGSRGSIQVQTNYLKRADGKVYTLTDEELKTIRDAQSA